MWLSLKEYIHTYVCIHTCWSDLGQWETIALYVITLHRSVQRCRFNPLLFRAKYSLLMELVMQMTEFHGAQTYPTAKWKHDPRKVHLPSFHYPTHDAIEVVLPAGLITTSWVEISFLIHACLFISPLEALTLVRNLYNFWARSNP